jgi:hypothetical protein
LLASLTPYCHNLGQSERKSPRVVLLLVGKPHHHNTPHHTKTGDDYINDTSRQPMKPSFGMRPFFYQTIRHMEDNLNILKMEDDLNILKMEDNLKKIENGRRPNFF